MHSLTLCAPILKDYLKRGKVLILGANELETQKLISEGYRVEGITLDDSHEIRKMDMHDLQYRPKTFNAVFSINTLEHCYSPWLLMLECRTVLKDKGIFFAKIDLYPNNRVVYHSTHISKDEWLSIFDWTGFIPLMAEISAEHFLVYVGRKNEELDPVVQRAQEEFEKIHEEYE
jgi:SAM-dependent methyltransferase